MGLRVALAQIDIAYGKPQINYDKVEQYLKQAATSGAEVVVLPELWNTGYDLVNLSKIADIDGKKTQLFLESCAQKYNLNIVGGSVAVKKGKQFYNNAYIVDHQGKLIGDYKKVHLFRLMAEDKYLAAGNNKSTFELAGIKSTVFICYDIRFPEWLRTVAKQGLDVMYIVAQWPKPRITQWRALLIARAIENQAYVIAVNCVGANPDDKFGGHSLIIDPLGRVLSDSGEQEKLTIYDLDLAKFKQNIQVFEDRRPELYE